MVLRFICNPPPCKLITLANVIWAFQVKTCLNGGVINISGLWGFRNAVDYLDHTYFALFDQIKHHRDENALIPYFHSKALSTLLPTTCVQATTSSENYVNARKCASQTSVFSYKTYSHWMNLNQVELWPVRDFSLVLTYWSRPSSLIWLFENWSWSRN